MGRVAAFLGFAILIAPAVGQDSAQARLRKSALSRVATPRPLHFHYLLPDGVEAAAKPECRRAAFGRTQILLVDVNGNGRFDEAGIDGWLPAGSRYVLPLEATIVVGTDVVEIFLASDGSTLEYSLAPIAGRKEILDALVLMNDLRMRNGLPPAPLDPASSVGCDKHCAYMQFHGSTHDEKEGLPGYTKEGAAAGAASCINPGPVKTSVQVWYDTFYHRLPLMHPGTRAFGIGSNGNYSAGDGMRIREARRWRWPIVIPAPDSEGHPTCFNGTGENPQPYENGQNPGCPITIAFPRGTSVEQVEAELREGGAAGKPVEILLSWPGKPAHASQPDNDDAICIMSRRPMRSKTAYSVRVSWRENGEAKSLSWAFATR